MFRLPMQSFAYFSKIGKRGFLGSYTNNLRGSHNKFLLDCAGRDGEPAEAARCANSSAAREAQALRAQCGRTLQAQERDEQRRRLWAWVGAGAGAVAAALALLALCCWCCRRRRARRASPARTPARSGKNCDEDEEDFAPMTKKYTK